MPSVLQNSHHSRNRLFGAILLLMVLSLSYATLGRSLLTRPLWMDEIHSWLLITDADVGHAMSALADGADYNPPTYYLVARLLAVFGPVTEYRLRLLSLFFTAATAMAMYLILSRRFTAAAALGATLLAASHRLCVLQSTETRFYALWMCLLMWYSWLLTKTVDGVWNRTLQRIGLALMAVAICTTHYFGIISVGLVTTAWTIGQLRQNRRSAIVQAAGLLVCCVIAVACCLPLLSGQTAALTCATWVKPPTIASSFDYAVQFLPMLPLGICIGAATAGWFSRQQPSNGGRFEFVVPPSGGTRLGIPYKFRLKAGRPTGCRNKVSDTEQPQSEDIQAVTPATWGLENTVLLASMLMPFVLIVFSWIVQPALVNRYAVVAIAGMVPIYAWLLSRATEAIQNTCVAIAACWLAFSVHNSSETWDHNLRDQFALRQSLSALSPTDVVVFEDRIDFWLLQQLQTAQDRPAAWYQADFENHDLVRPCNLRIVQRDVGRRTQKWYPDRFPIMPLATLTELHEFVVVPYVNRPFGELKFPNGYESTRINNRMYRLRRTTSGDAADLATALHEIRETMR